MTQHDDGDDARARPRGGARSRKLKRPLGDVDPVPTGRITGIHERRAGSARYLVAVEGRDVATVSAQVIVDLGLKVGAAVDPRLAEALAGESARVLVFDKAIDLLAVRARSERDLRLRLRRAGASAALIDAALERLRALGLVNDEAYAKQLAHSRVLGGGVSKRRIGQELQKRGVSREIADGAIDATLDEVELDEFGAARTAALKRLRSLRTLDAETRRRRLYGFLARRGYDHDVIARVLKDLASGAAGALGETYDDSGGDDGE